MFGGLTDKGGINNIGMQYATQISGGVIKYPKAVAVTGTASGSGGKIRLTVSPGSGGFATGMQTSVAGVGTGADGVRQLTVIDGTHIDLDGTNFGTFTPCSVDCQNLIGLGTPAWAIPGRYFFWSGTYGPSKSAQIVSVTEDSTATYIETTDAGGFPAIP